MRPAADASDTWPVNAQHEAKEFLGYLKVVASGTIVRHQQALGETLLQAVPTVTGGGLCGLRIYRLKVAEQQVLQNGFVVQGAPKCIRFHLQSRAVRLHERLYDRGVHTSAATSETQPLSTK